MNQQAYQRENPMVVGPVAQSSLDARSTFIMRTYIHVFGAIAAFTGIEFVLFQSGLAEPIARGMLSLPWLVILGAFIVVGWLASRLAHTAKSLSGQYIGLGAYVVAEALIFVPLLYIAESVAGGGVIQSAAYVTLLGFGALTAIAWATRADFSFLKTFLMWGGVCALGMIVASALFGFQLGIAFSFAMVAFAGAAILYDTSNIIHHYHESQYVGAALELFASVALLFWYVLQIFLERD